MGEPTTHHLHAPVSDDQIKLLHAGDRVILNGKIYVARDAAHKRFAQEMPLNLKGQILYYASPTPTPEGHVIGSIGPTTASRMDAFTPALLAKGLKITIGKGYRSQPVKDALKQNTAAYLMVAGGTAAYYEKFVKSKKVVGFEDLGPEAVLELEVENFPAIVAVDCYGGDVFALGKKKYHED